MKENPHSHSPRHSRGALAMALSVVFFPVWFPCWLLAVATAAQCDRTSKWSKRLQAKFRPYRYGGFTLIELSIVLVIIGLVVGGVLVGQELISKANVRAQVSQVEQFQSATATFQVKYAYLPGDIPASQAQLFGFAARGTLAGEGDGNGIVQGNLYGASTAGDGDAEGIGETVLFWMDLSAAHLIPGSFTKGSASVQINPYPLYSNFGLYYPAAAIGGGNYVYVFEGGHRPDGWVGQGVNYFGISVISSVSGLMYSSPGMTVQQAYSIDKKIDDGQPTHGRVVAALLNSSPYWMNGDWFPYVGVAIPGWAGDYTANAPSATSCYDNGNTAQTLNHYTLTQNNGNGVNCALSIRINGGDQ